MLSADKPLLWKADIAASVDLYNAWFMRFAPRAYRETRVETAKSVEENLRATKDMRECTAAAIRARPQIVPTLRMSTAPPIARDRLIGLAGVRTSLVHRLEAGKLPVRVPAEALDKELERICAVIDKLLTGTFSLGSRRERSRPRRSVGVRPPSSPIDCAARSQIRSSATPRRCGN